MHRLDWGRPCTRLVLCADSKTDRADVRFCPGTLCGSADRGTYRNACDVACIDGSQSLANDLRNVMPDMMQSPRLELHPGMVSRVSGAAWNSGEPGARQEVIRC